MRLARLSLKITASGPGLTVRFWFDGRHVHTVSPDPQHHIWQHDFPDQEGTHDLEIELAGKQPQHTELDQCGNILKDLVVHITEAKLEGVDIGQILVDKAVYYHDFNGTSSAVQEPFYGVMGCNGRVRFQFQSPSYLWLLEHL